MIFITTKLKVEEEKGNLEKSEMDCWPYLGINPIKIS